MKKYGQEFKTYKGCSKNRSYKLWLNIIKRCYDQDYHIAYPTYKECTICKEWKDYSNFEKWYDQQYIGEDYQLDKDILSFESKVYSPETCRFVPRELNMLLNKSSKQLDCNIDLPVGVSYKISYYKPVGSYHRKRTIDRYNFIVTKYIVDDEKLVSKQLIFKNKNIAHNEWREGKATFIKFKLKELSNKYTIEEDLIIALNKKVEMLLNYDIPIGKIIL